MEDDEDLLIGAKNIARFLWGDGRFDRRVYYYLETPGRIPVKKDIWSGQLYADPDALARWRSAHEGPLLKI